MALSIDALSMALHKKAFNDLDPSKQQPVITAARSYEFYRRKETQQRAQRLFGCTTNFGPDDIVLHRITHQPGMVKAFDVNNQRVTLLRYDTFEQFLSLDVALQFAHDHNFPVTPALGRSVGSMIQEHMRDQVLLIPLNGRLWSAPLFAAQLPESSSYFQVSSSEGLHYLLAWEAGYHYAAEHATAPTETVYEVAETFAGHRSHFLSDDSWESVYCVYIDGFHSAFKECTGRDINEEMNTH